VSELIYWLGFGLMTTAFALGVLFHIRRVKDKMRRSVLRFDRIKNKLED